MPVNALIQTRIDEDIKARASAVLEKSGLTVSDAVRIMLTRTANEGVFPIDIAPRGSSTEDFDAWFRAKVQDALEDPRPTIPHQDVEAHFALKRRKLLARTETK
ncbi:type II toxin-antitoxin system RelB/DinJ family antitoxin [Aquidulcibacter sp.]|jgi:DNA-damage-inducible protein J|uniref:type II toxin-antitoxin system RelB/DinJ family antitoxin n=1 Tax=Aquidulcibacter sp. TaxID=2052990 RepID=UPI0028ACAB35|nr:type II toxin-antitoxin system RelB/DinJ family antitoxin [Aquidulcibacter sp.]